MDFCFLEEVKEERMRFIHILASDFKRLFQSRGLYIAILSIAALAFFSVWPEVTAFNYTTSVYYLVNARNGVGAFFVATTVLIVLPFGLSYREDVRYNYIHCLEMRAGLTSYCWSHVIVTMVGGFLAVFCGYALCFGSLSIGLPTISPDEAAALQEYAANGYLGVYDSLMLSKMPVMYFITVFATEAMGYAFLAVFALMVSAKVENVFLILSVPIVFYYGTLLFSNITKLPGVFRWYNVLQHGGYFATVIPDIRQVMLCIFVYFGGLICLEGVVFSSLVERRCSRG